MARGNLMPVILWVLFLSVPLFSGELKTFSSYKGWRSQVLEDDKGWRHNIHIMQSMDEKTFKIHCSGANYRNKDVGMSYYGLKNLGIHASEKGITSFIEIKVDGKTQLERHGAWWIDSEIANFKIGTIHLTSESQWISSMKKGKEAKVKVAVYDQFFNELGKKEFDMSLDGFTCKFNNFKHSCTGYVGGPCPPEEEKTEQ